MSRGPRKAVKPPPAQCAQVGCERTADTLVPIDRVWVEMCSTCAMLEEVRRNRSKR